VTRGTASVAGALMLNVVVKSSVCVVLAMLVTAIGMAAYHGTVRIDGAISAWISGIGSLASALVALGIALYTYWKDRRERSDELKKATQRAMRRAKRVAMSCPGDSPLGAPSSGYGIHANIRNGSGAPLYEVKWYDPLVVFLESRQVYRYMTALTADSQTPLKDAAPRVLESGDGYTMRVDVTGPTLLTGRLWPFAVYPIAAFEDDDGNRFGWTLYRPAGASGNEIEGRWEFVDDDYPSVSAGVLRELLDQAESWPPDTTT
jgi:hypothetical protein